MMYYSVLYIPQPQVLTAVLQANLWSANSPKAFFHQTNQALHASCTTVTTQAISSHSWYVNTAGHSFFSIMHMTVTLNFLKMLRLLPSLMKTPRSLIAPFSLGGWLMNPYLQPRSLSSRPVTPSFPWFSIDTSNITKQIQHPPHPTSHKAVLLVLHTLVHDTTVQPDHDHSPPHQASSLAVMPLKHLSWQSPLIPKSEDPPKSSSKVNQTLKLTDLPPLSSSGPLCTSSFLSPRLLLNSPFASVEPLNTRLRAGLGSQFLHKALLDLPLLRTYSSSYLSTQCPRQR